MPKVKYKPTFYIRKDKRTQDGECPIYIRFQRINGKEPKFPIGINVAECDWDENTKRPTELALKIIIDKKQTHIEQHILNSIANDIEITAELLKEIVKGKEKPTVRSFYDYFDECVQNKIKRDKLTDSTVAGYKVTRNALKEYRSEIKLTDINTKFLEGFEKFLIKRANEKGKDDVKGSRSNRIKHVNAVLNYIERQGVAVENPYKKGDLDIPQADVNDVFLDFDELGKLVKYMYRLNPGTKQRRVLCMFLFSCATGLRYNDTVNLKWKNIDFDTDENHVFLNVKTQKTGRELNILIPELGVDMICFSTEGTPDNLDYEKNIFHRYSGNTANTILREIAQKVGIDKHITHNCSRRTFITLLKAQGLDDYSVMNYAGHSSMRMTERYMKWNSNMAMDAAKKVDLFKIKDLLKKKSAE